MGLGKIIVYGLAIFGAYQIYSWTTSNKEIKPHIYNKLKYNITQYNENR